MRTEDLGRLCDRAKQAYPRHLAMQRAFRNGCLSAWRASTIHHCPYEPKDGSLPFRLAWMDGFGWGLMENELSTRACFG